jgi:hypothetical protein
MIFSTLLGWKTNGHGRPKSCKGRGPERHDFLYLSEPRTGIPKKPGRELAIAKGRIFHPYTLPCGGPSYGGITGGIGDVVV